MDLWRLKSVMPDRWTAFIRAHHRSVEEVQFFYGVSARTAEYWWNGGTHKPSGHIIAIAALTFPDGFRRVFGDAA